MDLVGELERLTRRKARTRLLPFQEGDMLETYADISAASADLAFRPVVQIHEGLEKFVSWYKHYYQLDTIG